MWKAFLPHEVTLTLSPWFDSNKQQLRCKYSINGLPFLEWLTKQIVIAAGDLNIEHIKVTPEEIIINIPHQDLPYKIADITISDITIQLKKE